MSPESHEEDISLSGPAPVSKLDESLAEDDNLRPIQARVPHLQVAPGASDQDVLSQVLRTSTDQIFEWETCELPSQGRFYGWPDGLVRVRAMSQKAEQALATHRLAATGESLDRMFQACCQFPMGFDPLDLLQGDRTFLLYYIRGITHGNEYEFVITCPNQDCGETSPHTYDLNNLIRTVKRVPEALGVEPFKVVLPYFSEMVQREFWVSVRFMRGSDGVSMLAKRKRKQAAKTQSIAANRNPLRRKQEMDRRRMEVDETITENLEQMIVNVMGSDNPSDIHDLVQKLHASDTAAIRDWLRENTPGIDHTITIDCPHCDREYTVELPITESFFRPKKS